MRDPYGIDSHKLVYHPRRAAHVLEAGGAWSRGRDVYPLYVEISPIGACNHRCVFCAVDFIGYKTDRLELEGMQRTLGEMASLGVKSVCFAGEGEPLLHRQIASMIHEARLVGLDVALVTNASVLPADFLSLALPSLSWIKISINAGTAGTYAAVHQTREGDFAKVLDHMRLLVQAKREGGLHCTLGAQALLLPENAHEMELLAGLCRDIGMDYLVVKPYSQHLSSHTRRYETMDYQNFMGLGDRLARMGGDGFSVIFREKTMQKMLEVQPYDRCYATPYLWAYIMASGVVSGCSAYLLDPRFEYGNIKTESFQQIWQGEKRRRGLQLVYGELDIRECRHNCRMDEINRYLHAIHTGSPPHMNFI